MSAPLYSLAEYTAALQALLPMGRAWPRDTGTNQYRLLQALAASFQRSGAAAATLLPAAFPSSASDLMTEWESTLGLPGIYGTLASTDAGRRAQIVATLTDSGGQSKAYFIALAAALGITITITEYTRHTVRSGVSAAMSSDQWAHVWLVTGPASQAVTYTPTADITQATANFGIPVLEALLGAAKPAHTVVITKYV